MYALCLHAVETGIYADMPEILPQLQAMKSGLEMSYQRLGIPMFEYRKFVIHPKTFGVGEPCEPNGQKEASLVETTKKCLVGFATNSESSEFTSLQGKPAKPTKKGEEENVEMGTE